MTRALVLGIASFVAVAAIGNIASAADPMPKPAELFGKLDRNQDGKLTRDELGETQQKHFDRLVRVGDKNDDSELSRDEFIKALSRKKPPVVQSKMRQQGLDSQKQAERIFDRLDKNGDLQLTVEEVKEGRKRLVQRYLKRVGKSKEDVLTKSDFIKTHIQWMRQKQRMKAKAASEKAGTKTAAIGKNSKKRKKNPNAGKANGQAAKNQPGRAAPLMRALDTNRDGRLDRSELEQAAAQFEKLDRNNDGSLDRRELFGAGQNRLAVAKKSGAQPKKSPKRTKRPQGGRPSVEKFLKRFDKNDDGTISEDEAPKPLKRRFSKVDANSDGELDAAELKAGFERRAKKRSQRKKRGKKKQTQVPTSKSA